MHPLMRVPGRWRKDFLDSLSERDRREYELAVAYWRETWHEDKGMGSDLSP